MTKLMLLGGEDVSARIEMSKKLLLLGYTIEIIGTENEEVFKKNKIIYRRYSLNRELNIFDDIKTLFGLRSILKEQSVECIVHAFDTKPTMFLPIAALGLKNIKVVRTITGVGRIFTENNVKNFLLRNIYKVIQKIINLRIDKTIFQNDDDFKYFVHNALVESSKAVVIKSSGLNLAEYRVDDASKKNTFLINQLKIDVNKITFILVSRMVKQKGILNYLEAAKLCSENGYTYNFLLVGQLDTDNSITIEEIDKYKEYVTYLGRREDIKELMLLSDIFVLPTYYREGVPRVLLEASALGLALITTDMPGCKDVVIDEYNGKLVRIKDSKDLYDKMIYVAENNKLDTYSKNAKEKVKEFDLDIVVNRYHEVYNSIKGK